jgi:GNAT superfamily N-acetyltransferase
MPTFMLRDPTLADFPEWKALFDGYNAFYGRAGPTALPTAVIEATWQRIHDPQEPVHALVAEEHGNLVGLTHFLYHRTTVSIAQTCYLQDLFTLPEARGRGIARALIEAVYERARQAGAARVYWQTHETNTTAQRLYDKVAERSGFIVYRHSV